ncbi:MAG: glycosyltransferase family 39 protein [Methanobacteriaceae archaeon]|nr:glycosyltransferase family 39 protein [Methanobacteriaceae archaeon]
MFNWNNFLKDNKWDIICILVLLSFILSIGIFRLYTQIDVGIGNWDTYLYLANGRSFAKMGYGDVASISPVVPYILSIIFRIVGHPFEESIFILDTMGYILGVIALYLILRFRFDYYISLIGCVIFGSFTLLLSWVALGGNDIVGMSLMLCAIYFILKAKFNNWKWLYIALPLSAFAFLARYTSGILLFSLIFYLFMDGINKEKITYLIKSSIFGIILVSPALYHFNRILGTPFPFLGQFSGTVSNTAVIDAGYLPNIFYYITNLPTYLFSSIPYKSTFEAVINPSGNIVNLLGYLMVGLLLLAFVFYLVDIYKGLASNNIKNNKYILTGICIVILLFVLTFNTVSYLVSIILMFIGLYLVYLLVNNLKLNDKIPDIDFFMFGLFGSFLIFESILSTKNDRYFITTLPFIAYFISVSISRLMNYYDLNPIIYGHITRKHILTGLIIILLLISSLGFISSIPKHNHFNYVKESCNWYEDTYSNNNTTVIYSDNWPAVNWYLNKYIHRAVPYSQFPNVENETWRFSNYLENSPAKADYYFDTNSIEKLEYPGFNKLKTIGEVVIYKNEHTFNNSSYINNSTKSI